jgi:hypothetical protein
MSAAPTVKAFLIADAVIQDRLTRKWTIVNVFDQIFAPQFPCVHPSMALYVKLGDARGRYAVRVELRDADDAVLSKIEGLVVEAAGPTHAAEFGVTAQGLPLKAPGRCQFQLYLNDEYAAAASLDIVQFQPPPGTPA